MDTALLGTGVTVVSTVVLLFLGAWETARRNRQAEARKDAAAERAALQAQADELVAAVLALRVAGNTHDHIWGGWAARGWVALRALAHGSIAYGLAGRTGPRDSWLLLGRLPGPSTAGITRAGSPQPR
ncbi:hypothetical protein ACWGF3_27725 [Streptomyces xanthophaeus]